MSVQAIQASQSTIESSHTSSWKGRVVTDESYLKRSAIRAGVGPEMLYGVGSAFMLFGAIGASLIASVAVGIATQSLRQSLITLGGCGIGSVLLMLGLKMYDPKL